MTNQGSSRSELGSPRGGSTGSASSTKFVSGSPSPDGEAEGFSCFFDSIEDSLKFGPPVSTANAYPAHGEEAEDDVQGRFVTTDIGPIIDAEFEPSKNRLVTVHKPLEVCAPGQKVRAFNSQSDKLSSFVSLCSPSPLKLFVVHLPSLEFAANAKIFLTT